MLLFALLFGCDGIHRDYLNKPIYREGTYYLDGGNYVLTVKIIEESIVTYKVMSHGSEVLASKEEASLAMKWYVFMDERKWLWVMSSDIGNYVWLPDSKGTYQEFNFGDRLDLIKEVPEKIRASYLK